jgi:hypothetical protein
MLFHPSSPSHNDWIVSCLEKRFEDLTKTKHKKDEMQKWELKKLAL